MTEKEPKNLYLSLSPGAAELTREERRACAHEYYEAAQATLTIWEALRDED